MLLRPEGETTICIGQPAHAFLSGQIAARWSPRPEPYEEVVLAATQHDAGMADWDAAPELNPETGLPQSFMEMDLHTHLRLWTHAPHRVLPQSRYAALLVSMHGVALYEMRDLSRMSDADAEAVRRYIEGQRAFQGRVNNGVDMDRLRQNQQLLWVWDFLSLGLCLRWHGRSVNCITLEENTIDPWPFVDSSLRLHVDGRRVEPGGALEDAPWTTLTFELKRRP